MDSLRFAIGADSPDERRFTWGGDSRRRADSPEWIPASLGGRDDPDGPDSPAGRGSLDGSHSSAGVIPWAGRLAREDRFAGRAPIRPKRVIRGDGPIRRKGSRRASAPVTIPTGLIRQRGVVHRTDPIRQRAEPPGPVDLPEKTDSHEGGGDSRRRSLRRMGTDSLGGVIRGDGPIRRKGSRLASASVTIPTGLIRRRGLDHWTYPIRQRARFPGRADLPEKTDSHEGGGDSRRRADSQDGH